MKEIITTNTLTIAEKVNFKDKRLAKATSDIIKIYQDAMVYADAKNRQVASILAKIKEEKSYIEDGFVSVADYASEIFGIKKQNAYSLATAGEIYNDPRASEKLKAFTPSKLAEVASVNRETLETDVESGKITPTTTQKDLREYYKKTSGKTSKDEVLDLYTAHATNSDMIRDGLYELIGEYNIPPTKRLMQDWEDMIAAYINKNSKYPVEVIKLPKGHAVVDGVIQKKKIVERRLFITHEVSFAVEFTVYKPRIEKQNNEMTREELLAKLAELEAKVQSELDEADNTEEVYS